MAAPCLRVSAESRIGAPQSVRLWQADRVSDAPDPAVNDPEVDNPDRDGDDAMPDEESEGGRFWNTAARSVGDLVRSAGAKIDDTARSAETAKTISDLEDRISAFRRERKVGKGTLRSTFVAAYRGFADSDGAHVRVRVMEEPVLPASAEDLPKSAVVKSNLRRFVSLALPGTRLSVTISSESENATDAVSPGPVVSDRHGYATTVLAVPDTLAPGWHDYTVETIPDDPDEDPTVAVGQILVPDPTAQVAVISDIDDTVLRTGLSEGMVAVRNTLLGEAHTRRPVPGMSELYRRIDESNRPAQTMFCYVSTGSWALYDMLVEFLDLSGFPRGPLFLTSWGPQERYVMRSGREHKRTTLRRIFEAYPEQEFVLIGDSGQKDPDAYLEIQSEHPGQVRAIIIVDVGEHMAERADELRELASVKQALGIEFHFVDDADAAGAVLERLGVIAEPS